MSTTLSYTPTSTLTYASPASVIRLLGSAGLAIMITMTLLTLMRILIDNDLPELADPVPRIRSAIMEPPPKPENLPPEIAPRPDQVEPPPEITMPSFDNQAGDLVLPTGPTPRPVIEKTDLGQSASAGIVAIFKVQPDYPARALTRGIEGYVVLLFDITAAGAVTNIRVVAADPEGVFDRSAIRALAKWKYKAPTEDGVPYGQQNMMTRMTYELED